MMSRNDALKILDKLRDAGIPDSSIVDYIIGNHLSGSAALDVMVGAHEEFLDGNGDDDEEYAHWTFV